MKYIGENAIKKLISLIKGDLATKQPTITASGLLKGDGAGTVTAADTQEATLVDVPNGLLKGDGTTISAAVAGTDYVNSSQAIRYDAAQTLTAAQKTQARANIAAAPDGFGLGANGDPNPYTVVTGATIDALNASGLFWYRDTNTPIYPDGWNSGTIGNLLHIGGDGHNTLAERQIFYPYYPYYNVALNISCMRMKTNGGNWQPWEWVNPPMMLGDEYRTTERYLGKPVYVKKVDFGNAPAGSIKEVGCATNVANVVDFNLTVWNGDYGQENIIINDDGTIVARPYSKLAEGTLSIALAVFEDISNRTVDLVVKYTKTTD